jgi:hypothetical protein
LKKNPLDVIDENNLKENYNTNLLGDEIKTFQNLFTEKAVTAIQGKRENLEMVKKIIEYYLTYVVELNFDSISITFFK